MSTPEKKHQSLEEAFKGLGELPRLAPITPAATETDVPVKAPAESPTSEPTATQEQPDAKAPEVERDVIEEAAPAPTREQTKPAKSSRRSSRTAATAEDAGSADGTKEVANQPIPVSVSAALGRRLRAYKTAQGASFPSVIFDAIESTYEQLPELLGKKTVRTESSHRLFSRPQTVVRRTVSDGPREQIIMRITKTNKQVLESLAGELGAPNRNVLIETALDAFLPPDDER